MNEDDGMGSKEGSWEVEKGLDGKGDKEGMVEGGEGLDGKRV
jgi:hypothetical protein